MNLVPLPIDNEQKPLVDHLLSLAIERYKAGKNPVQLQISSKNAGYSGRVSLLMGERLLKGENGLSGNTRSWTGPEHTGVIEAMFD